jgi:hypothetical protein
MNSFKSGANPMNLAIAFLMPLIQFVYLLVMQYTFDVTNIAAVVYDQDKSLYEQRTGEGNSNNQAILRSRLS